LEKGIRVGDIEAALQIYSDATNYIASAGLSQEVQWQRDADFNQFGESDLLREAAWVILCSGFREAAVRRIFDHVSLCFCDWESASAIVEAYPACNWAARASFNSRAKIDAITEVARHVHDRGFAVVKEAVLADPVSELTKLPFIGPITVWHLAKNLGLDAVKPDRHLVRISEALGFPDPNMFCDVIAEESGEPVRVVDLIIWRYMADNPAQFRSFRGLKRGVAVGASKRKSGI
jgi:hypothetical protein